jgi:hypothetical protein
MKALNAIKWVFDKWWLLPMITFICYLANLISVYWYNRYLDYVSGNLALPFSFFLICSFIYHLFKKRWLIALGVFMSIMVVTVMGMWGTWVYMMAGADYFADDLEMPTGVVIVVPYPIEKREFIRDSINSLNHPVTFIQVYKDDFQPGIYNYDFWSHDIGSGIVYLKVFEVTKGTPLNGNRLPMTTALHVGQLGDRGTSSSFKIYEGDWGKPYAARFEVWFKPADSSVERKVSQKIYKIEGWQR